MAAFRDNLALEDTIALRIAMTGPNFADKTIWTGDNLDILRGDVDQLDSLRGYVDADPLAAQLVGGDAGGGAAAEGVEHHVALVTAGLDDAFE